MFTLMCMQLDNISEQCCPCIWIISVQKEGTLWFDCRLGKAFSEHSSSLHPFKYCIGAAAWQMFSSVLSMHMQNIFSQQRKNWTSTSLGTCFFTSRCYLALNWMLRWFQTGVLLQALIKFCIIQDVLALKTKLETWRK